VDIKNLNNLEEFLFYEKTLLFINKQSKDVLKILRKLELSDIVTVLQYFPLIVKNNLFFIES